ncbi:MULTISPECIES: DNA adenine methylase [Staphylococcus]|uniref:DNA adenine methylase n=1 Tax=Staphylococcus TaxID=1279 RepID=UPI00066B0400|nr:MULTISPECIES: Dam family site-specific DNA-(adenine-N6)-methyltransferase [Staphylococcus]MEB6285234.1 Dam family site-specific DNA-(adenine-N6)-methyltransferase [Staphylococcus haemolyticus]OFN17870.1 DNA adenine methylase [Staphylococcus sp. HMSC058D09]
MTKYKNSVPQLLKWIGNKHRFAEEIVSYMPDHINTYYEPFLGSGAVLATLSSISENSLFPKYDKAIASDILPFLIDIFNIVQSNPYLLINYYQEHITNFNDNREANYLEIRNRFNRDYNALDFALLVRTCYSGIVRFRKSDGYMSTPIGPHNPISPSNFEKRVLTWNRLLQNNIEFKHANYLETMRLAKEGDLIYCDPPYTHSQSIIYGAQNFKIEELWHEIEKCKNKGVKVMLSINGKKKSGLKDISIPAPKGLFERSVFVNCGPSMINRLQRQGQTMNDEIVHDSLFFTW